MTDDRVVIKSNRNAQRGSQRLKAADQARKIAEIASDRQASDILLLDVRQVCNFADYFVMFSAETHRHTEALRQEVSKRLGEDGIRALHIEGDSDSGWVLMDYGDVIVHIFSPAEREYYQLDKLWEDATTVLRIQ
ncbi:MAG: ribosome silencing factor [Dehalococcoidia bacterium]